jgi:NADH:ubiquinone oxidoreductase subunit 5 (subunit L)/multisubunit Na+/H+ antiporter MnhA subunit
MDPSIVLPILLGLAWLLPLASFTVIVFLGPRLGKAGRGAAFVATAAIATGLVLSLAALAIWVGQRPLAAVSGTWYLLGRFGALEIAIGYYIDSLTVTMFCMVTLVATCIHVYSYGYMHEELHDVTDSLATLANGQPLKRRGRFHRFFQYLSLFCFSMLGLVVAGNVAMVFVFWELVGICSYLLIGFYFERKSASDAANKAFITNRVGDFGMLIGLMVIWSGLGTFSFADYTDAEGNDRPGIFTQVRPAGNHHQLTVPDGMVLLGVRSDPKARVELEQIHQTAATPQEAERAVRAFLPQWRDSGFGKWLLVIAGLGIFCGCVGKSAQFPLHVWLPDAMEGPTPVSALIHAATMVAAGVYLVGRFYPVFTPEVLLVIAVVGCITLFIAATIALTATDIKRVLAYSTVSQLGYMMLALGVGGWVAGLFHLFTHAFFKALLFLGSGSVIHACGTNEMPSMGGLLKKLPWTAGTMLVGCLAISGAGIPLVIGLSGYYSKDAVLAAAYSFACENPAWGWLFYVAAAGAAMTAFYMFRLWFLTFLGKPRDQRVFDHAHESPKVMYVPLVVLALFSIVAGWQLPLGNFGNFGLRSLIEQAQPQGIAAGAPAGLLLSGLSIPPEFPSDAHVAHDVHVKVSLIAFGSAALGLLLAAAMYAVPLIDPESVRRRLQPLYVFSKNKWYFDELYRAVLVRPAILVARGAAAFDREVIDRVAHGCSHTVRGIAVLDEWFDRVFVDRIVNLVGRWTCAAGVRLKAVQTGNVRQYVMWLVVGAVGLFVLVTLVLGSPAPPPSLSPDMPNVGVECRRSGPSDFAPLPVAQAAAAPHHPSPAESR